MLVLTRTIFFPAVAVAFLASTAPAQPDKFLPLLSAPTADGWRQYAAATESRIDAELKAPKGFLALEFGSSPAGDRAAILAGQMPVAPMLSPGPNGKSIDVPDGWVHHWRGAVLVRGVRLKEVFQRLQEEIPGVGKGDVVAAQILRREGPSMRTFIKLQRSGRVILSFNLVYHTEHEVMFTHRTDARGTSTSTATKIAELDEPGSPQERELGPGQDHRLLQRWNSYWRYEEVPAGVIVECESITLSRTGPWGWGRGIADRTASESMEKALTNLRGHFATAGRTPPVSSPAR